jgi:hypothetical protein
MKMVKSLLLGTAAGLVAMAGAQAADLPVKAKPAQYVKICSLYGAGFYYVPGTDTCLKVGGWVRAEYNINATGSFGPIWSGANALNTRASTRNTIRSRGWITLDAREQTQYGTLRAYIMGGFQGDNGTTGLAIPVNRFFVQWGGFTAGLATSLYAHYSGSAHSFTTPLVASDTGGTGQNTFAYTAQLGNGISASIGLDDPYKRTAQVVNTGLGAAALATTGLAVSSGAAGNGSAVGKLTWPDVIGALRVDQAWGSAQIMGAGHLVSAPYNGALETSGHVESKMGYAFGAGLTLKLPMLGAGDVFQIEGNYARGAVSYAAQGFSIGFTGASFSMQAYEGTTIARGIVSDAVYSGVAGSALELTKSYSLMAGYTHNWSPQFDTSILGQYVKVDYDTTATGLLNASLGQAAGTSQDFSWWAIGFRNRWKPVKNLMLGVEVMYSKLETASSGVTQVLAPGGAKPTQAYTFGDIDQWHGIFRVERYFYQ